MARLKKESLAERVAKVIQKDLENGIWIEKLPGYRVLATRYGVSRPTCCEALIILQNKGYLAAPEPKRNRKIIYKGSAYKPVKNNHLLVIVESTSELATDTHFLLRDILSYWKTSGGSVSLVSVELMEYKQPKTLLNKLIKQDNASCILTVTPSTPWIQAVEQTELPCYTLGGAMHASSGKISNVGFPLPAFIASLIPDIIEKKHSRILVVNSEFTENNVMGDKIKQLATLALEELNEASDTEITVASPESNQPEDWHSWWQKILIEKQPSLVILDSTYASLSLHSYCMRLGIRMPQDLSIIVTHHTPILAWLNPSPTSFRHVGNESLKHFQHWVEKGFPHGQLKAHFPITESGQTYGIAPY